MRTFLNLDQMCVTSAFAVQMHDAIEWAVGLLGKLLLREHNAGESVGYSDVLAGRMQGTCTCTISDWV